jgi:hypothetical protein
MLTQESGNRQFDANGNPITSPKGAVGIAQIMPTTGPVAAKMAGLAWDADKFRNDPQYNQALGQAYYNAQLQKFGSPELAAAAYNAGPGAVQKWINQLGDPRKGDLTPQEFATQIPYAETRNYVNNVVGGIQKVNPPNSTNLPYAGFNPNQPNPLMQDKQLQQMASTYKTNVDSGVNPLLADKQLTTMANKAKADPSFVQQIADTLDSLGEKGVGAMEAGANLLTGATTGPIAGAVGTVEGIGKSVANGTFGTQQGVQQAENTAAQRMQQYTYQPTTPEGIRQSQAVGQLAEQLLPVAPMAGQFAPLAASAEATAPIAAGYAARGAGVASDALQAAQKATNDAAAAVQSGAGKAAQAVTQAFPGGGAEPPMSGVGAAEARVPAQRIAAAQSLDIPVPLTLGQATRDFDQLKFEKETAKTPLGKPFRDLGSDQTGLITQNFDKLIDDTGGQVSTPRQLGQTIDTVIQNKAQAAKQDFRDTYSAAQESGEMASPVKTDGIADALNNMVSAESVAPVITAAKRELQRLGGGAIDENGNVVGGQLSINDMEALRRLVNKSTGTDPTNIKFAGDIKRAIDAATEGAGGDIYQKARALRANYAQEFENQGAIKQLMSFKPGTTDRRIALEDVFDKSIMNGSRDDVGNLRLTLESAGPEGKQAWQDVKAATLDRIKSEAIKGMQFDEKGQPIISPSALNKIVTELDADGKLDLILGKPTANKVRTINDLAKNIYTAPPGSVNHSNTSSAIMAALDLAGSAISGIPAPIATLTNMAVRAAKERKIKAKVEASLPKDTF